MHKINKISDMELTESLFRQQQKNEAISLSISSRLIDSKELRTQSDTTIKFKNLADKYKKLKMELVKCHQDLNDVTYSLFARKYSYKDFEKLYKEHDQRDITVNQLTFIDIDLTNSRHKSLLNKVQFRQLPDISGVWLWNVNQSKDEINRFLKVSIPKRVKWIMFNLNPNQQANGEVFIDSLCYAAKNIKTNFTIHCTNLSNTEFWRFIESASHCIELCFYRCTIDTSNEWDFSGISTSNIQRLSLRSWGASRHSDWSLNPQKFTNILKGISNKMFLSITRYWNFLWKFVLSFNIKLILSKNIKFIFSRFTLKI